jgi:hypothetical protein
MADKKRDDDDDRRGPGAGPAARTPQGDHTPRQEEQAFRDEPRAGRARRQAASSEDKAAAEKQQAELRAGWAAASIGAQVILDFNEDGSLGARGGAAGTIEGNVIARDTWLGQMGLDPVNCSGPARARVEGEEEPEARPARPLPDARATKASSLAAGISQGAADRTEQQRAHR